MSYAITIGIGDSDKSKQISLGACHGWMHRPLDDYELASMDPDLAERIRATVEAALLNDDGKCVDDDDHDDQNGIPTLHDSDPDDEDIVYFAKDMVDRRIYQLDGVSWQSAASTELIDLMSDDLVDKITDAVATAAQDAVKALLNAKSDKDEAEAPIMPSDDDPVIFPDPSSI